MKDWGLLILRIGIGSMFAIHGWPKISGEPEKWAKLGSAVEAFGIYFLPSFWGFMAAFSEFFGGIFLILGIFFIPANILLFATMAIAVAWHISKGDGFNDYSHAAEAAILFLSLIFVGPGKFAVMFKNK